MKPAILLIAFLVAAQGATTALAAAKDVTQDGITMHVAFNPNPPKRGSDTVIVSLKDQNGEPLRGATVKIATTMPTMSMSGPTAAAKDNGDGTYTATISLTYATKWSLDVSASVKGKTAHEVTTSEVH